MPGRPRLTRWQATAIGAMLVMIIGALGAPPATAAPLAPGGLLPANVSVTGTPVLQWNAVTGASSYQVEVSSTAEFATTLWKTSTTNIKATPTVQLPPGVVWWQVRAVDSSGAGPWSVASFDRSRVAGPTLLSPNADASLAQPAEPALLSWTPVHGATGYTVEISTDPNLTDPALTKSYTTKTSSMVVPSPQVATDYYWRVRATLAANIYTEWSETRRYQIGGLSKPVLVGPANGTSTRIDDVVLDWLPVPGAKTYDVQVSTDINFLTLESTSSPSGVTGTRYSPPTTLGNDQYYWRVRPVDALGNKLDWKEVDTWAFKREWPEQPRLEYPIGGATVGNPFYYQWTPVRLASSYTIELSKTADFNAGDIVDSCTTVHTTFTPTNGGECWPSASGSYYWRVIAKDDPKNVVSDKIVAGGSDHRGYFHYEPGVVSLTSPGNGTSVQIPTLRWEPVAGAESYKVTVTAIDGGSGGGEWTTTGTSYTLRGKLTVGKTYRWQVRTLGSLNRVGAALLETSQPTFTVAPMPEATASSPEPIGPGSGGSFMRFPTLTWQPVLGATSYRVLVRPAGTQGWTRLGASFSYPAGEDDGSTWLSADTYEWMVEAYNSAAVLSTSVAATTFTITNLIPVTGQRAALTGTATTQAGSFCNISLPDQCKDLRQTPVLRWDPQPNAGYYQIYLSRDQELTNPVPGFNPVRVESNMWMPSAALIDSQAGSAFFWFVQPCKANGKCAPLAHATNAFNKISNPVELLSPIDSETVQDDVTFTWRDYLETNLEATPGRTDATGVNARIEAKQYKIEVSTDPNFQTTLETLLVDQTTFTSFAKTYPEGLVYWRVQALDGSGNPLAWSAPRSFLKESPKPTLQAPINGASVAGNEPFVWSPVNFAGSYDIELYRNGDTTGSPANLVWAGNSQQVAYTPTRPLAASSSAYTWRVRRVDAMGRKGAWSLLSDPRASFRVTGQPPTLGSPAAGSNVQSKEALFTWQPPTDASSGVASYRFERRTVGSSYLSEVVSTPTLAWAPTTALATGSWEWRVTSLNAEGAVLASSSWRPFSVGATTTPPPPGDTTPPPPGDTTPPPPDDTTTPPPPDETTTPPPPRDLTRPTVISRSPLTTARRTANFVVKFSEKVTGVNRTTMRLYRKGSTTPLAARVTLSDTKRVATLNPNRNLRSGKVYIIRLTSGITDLSRNKLLGFSWRVRAR